MSEPRTEAGRRLLARWSVMADLSEDIAAVEAEAGDLGCAWAEAEAALPEGWELMGLYARADESYPWGAQAQTRGDELNRRVVYVGGPTPAAALRALAAKLREM